MGGLNYYVYVEGSYLKVHNIETRCFLVIISEPLICACLPLYSHTLTHDIPFDLLANYLRNSTVDYVTSN